MLPCQRAGQIGGSNMNWAVPIDDFTTRWLGVSFHPYGKDGKLPESAMRRMAPDTPNDSGGPFYDGWYEDIGYWWNTGHPLRQGPIWEDEAIMTTQGSNERNRLPNWDKWRLGTSDRGVLLMHELWEEQVERVQEGLDPLGIIRGPQAEQIIPLPGENLHLSWDEGMRLFNMSLDERIDRRVKQIEHR